MNANILTELNKKVFMSNQLKRQIFPWGSFLI